MLIDEALKQATDAQIKSEWARRTQAMRKTRSGGRKTKGETQTVMPRYIRKPSDVSKAIPVDPRPANYYTPSRFKKEPK